MNQIDTQQLLAIVVKLYGKQGRGGKEVEIPLRLLADPPTGSLEYATDPVRRTASLVYRETRVINITAKPVSESIKEETTALVKFERNM